MIYIPMNKKQKKEIFRDNIDDLNKDVYLKGYISDWRNVELFNLAVFDSNDKTLCASVRNRIELERVLGEEEVGKLMTQIKIKET